MFLKGIRISAQLLPCFEMCRSAVHRWHRKQQVVSVQVPSGRTFIDKIQETQLRARKVEANLVAAFKDLPARSLKWFLIGLPGPHLLNRHRVV